MAKKKEEVKEYDILKHLLVPKHAILKEDEIKEVLKKYNIKIQQLPKILTTDAAVKAIGAKEGDVIKITRESPTAGSTTYFRLVKKGSMR